MNLPESRVLRRFFYWQKIDSGRCSYAVIVWVKTQNFSS